MTTALPPLEPDGPLRTSLHSSTSPSQPPRPQRVLACILCQQRKIRCDRNFPCANCVRSRAQCVPASQVRRPRKRRFPERELLDRLRRYENLLRQNGIQFEPLHKDWAQSEDQGSPSTLGVDDSNDEQPASSPSATVNSEKVAEAKNFWDAINQKFRDHDKDSDSSYDDVGESEIRKVWDQAYANADSVLLGGQHNNTMIDLSTFHPEPAQIFKLWQVYLDNVDPLLKVTHNPSLQGRIIEAASNVTNIDPILEALMFGIYCMSIQSLDANECQVMFGSSKDDLFTRFHFACHQALSSCGFLQTADRNCLTAFYLFLVSAGQNTHPRALSSMLGIAIRTAQRIGIHSESENMRCGAMEAEMRRRLWWSLVLFDSRIGELADCKIATLAPTWDCKVPLNINDSDLRPEMKEAPPAVKGKPTEALFAVVRSELGDFVRHAPFHLDFTNPDAKPTTRTGSQEDGELATLKRRIEEGYLQSCDPENPLHYMTIWTTRAHLARCYLILGYARSERQTPHQRDAALCYALTMLDCDSKPFTSPLTKGFRWFPDFHFPFLAYMHVLRDLRRRPVGELADKAWEVMSENYTARCLSVDADDSPLHDLFTKIVLQAWEAREREGGSIEAVPGIVEDIRRRVAKQQAARQTQTQAQAQAQAGTGNVAMDVSTAQAGGEIPMTLPDFPIMPMAMGFGGPDLLYGGFGAGGGPGFGPPGMPGPTPYDFRSNWAAMRWAFADMCMNR